MVGDSYLGADLVPGPRRRKASGDDDEYSQHSTGSHRKRSDDESSHHHRHRSHHRHKKSDRGVDRAKSQDPKAAQKESEEQLKKAEEEKRKKEQEEAAARKKAAAKRRLRILFWKMIFANFLFVMARRQAIRRRDTSGKEYFDHIGSYLEETVMTVFHCTERALLTLVNEKRSICMVSLCEKGVFGGTKRLSVGEIEERCKSVFTIAKTFLDDLSDRMKDKGAFSPSLTVFLRKYIKSKAFLPQDFIFDFELKRLCFTNYGDTKMMTPQRSKMLLAFWILVRALIFRVILKPWEIIKTLNAKDEVLRRNVKCIGSVLLQLVVDYVRGNLAVVVKNQAHLPNEARTRPRAKPLKAEEVRVDAEGIYARPKKLEEDEICDDVYTRDQMGNLFLERRKLYFHHVSAGINVILHVEPIS
jgi:hypothetical protein